MTPKQKADELVSKFISIQNKWYLDNLVDGLRSSQAKQSALISVDEVLFTLNEISEEDNSTYAYHTAVFYNEVKTEIEKL